VLVRTLALIVAAACIPGCYTIFKHPAIMEMNFRRPAPDQPCTACHAWQRIGFLRPNALAPEPSPWGDLDHPWWIDRAASPDTTRGDGGTSH